jgi:hypothetical protein
LITYHGIQTQSAAADKSGVRTATIVYTLTADSGEGPFAVGRNAFLPRIGSVHPEDSGCWCVSGSVDLSDPKTGYTVTANYSSERQITEDPLAEPANIEWDTEQFQEPLVKDEDDKAVVNSAGDPFNPPVMRDNSRWFVEVSCNVATVPTWVLTYPDAVNEDAFTIDGVSVAVGQAKIQKLKISGRRSRNDIAYRVVTYSLYFREDGWHFKPLDVGFHEINEAGERKLIVLLNDEQVPEYPTSPVQLDGAGAHVAEPTLDTGYYHDFVGYNTKPFNILPAINT